ncbi:MAG: chorismate-binding protein [Deltaproteobacteria bacterium]|nr:chorismate-binding protein [Deltaproteobacteria bacterium]
MDRDRFLEWAGKANVIPVYREILADRDTPVGLLYKLGDKVRFLLESVEGGERWGRYSILGLEPEGEIVLYPNEASIRIKEDSRRVPVGADPLALLREQTRGFRPAEVEGIPRFSSGLVGYFSYELIHFLERMPSLKAEAIKSPLAYLLLVKDLIVFDNVKHTMKVVVNAYLDDNSDPIRVYEDSLARIEALMKEIENPVSTTAPEKLDRPFVRVEPEDQTFEAQVQAVQEYIRAGEAIQVVISREFSLPNVADTADLYRALRYVNPSPYLFLLRTPQVNLIGSSPEVMVRKERNTATVRPIAGTRPRGGDEHEDQRLADELLNDPKEKAEHVMLVDLARNDLGRVAQIGTVQVTEYMTIERYSHVMHLVSNVTAELEKGKDCYDVIAATFPAGTLTGAPKVRAMEIIHEMESGPRGPYGGAVGYIGFDGEMDLCITIRTLVQSNGRISWRAGAGIVFDSVPQNEAMETVHKGRAMERAVEMAINGLRL